MTKMICGKAFDDGLARRALHPLHSGEYKLLEALDTWMKRKCALDVVVDAVKRDIPIPSNYDLFG